MKSGRYKSGGSGVASGLLRLGQEIVDRLLLVGEMLGRLIREALPSRTDSPETRWFKVIVYACFGVLAASAVLGAFTFLLSIEGGEETLVPDVRQVDLADALVLLQDKELFGMVQLRFSSDPNLRGKVLDQRPAPGTAVKAGKRVALVVSRGAVVDQVEDYVGKKVDEVRGHLQETFASFKPLLSIQEPPTYIYDPAPEGTVLEQKPVPGTELAEPTLLQLVVSRGPEPEKIAVPSFAGMKVFDALTMLAQNQIPFVFVLAGDNKNNPLGTTFDQDPPPGTEISANAKVTLHFTFPKEVPKGKVFGVFEYSLPDYPVPVDLRIDNVATNGERFPLFSLKHPGGMISFPYVAEENSTMVLSIFNREIIRHVVQAPSP